MKATAVLVVIVVLGVVLLGLSSCAVVPPGHRAVSITLGSVHPQPIGEGFHFKKPLIESYETFSIQQTTVNLSASCFSSDLQQIDIQCSVMVRIPEGKIVTLYQEYKGDVFATLVEPRVQESLKQVTAKYTAENIVKSREAIRVAALDHVRLAVGDLLQIVDLNIVNIDLSEHLEKAIEEKMVQQQEALAMQFKYDKAMKDAEIVSVNARAEADAIRLKGEALAEMPLVIQLEIIRKWDGKSPSTVVLGNGDSGAQVVFPLPGVVQQARER